MPDDADVVNSGNKSRLFTPLRVIAAITAVLLALAAFNNSVVDLVGLVTGGDDDDVVELAGIEVSAWPEKAEVQVGESVRLYVHVSADVLPQRGALARLSARAGSFNLASTDLIDEVTTEQDGTAIFTWHPVNLSPGSYRFEIAVNVLDAAVDDSDLPAPLVIEVKTAPSANPYDFYQVVPRDLTLAALAAEVGASECGGGVANMSVLDQDATGADRFVPLGSRALVSAGEIIAVECFTPLLQLGDPIPFVIPEVLIQFGETSGGAFQ